MGIEINKIVNINNAANAGLKASETSSLANVSIMSANADDIELLKKLGVTKEEFQLLTSKYPDIDIKSLPLDKQLQLVADYRAEVKQTAAQRMEAKENADNETSLKTVNNETKSGQFNKKEYNKLSLEEKIDACITEFAKSQYIYGTKHDGKVISEPHSQEEWDALAPEEQNSIIEKAKSALNNDEKLKELKKLILLKTDNEIQTNMADTVMRGIQAANRANMSYLEFMHKDEYEQMDLIDTYLAEETAFSNDSLNKNDKDYIAHWQLMSSAVKDEVLKRNSDFNVECSQDAREYIKRNNLNEGELIHNALKAKVDKGIKLSPNEQKEYDNLKYIETDTGKFYIQKAKARNLSKLQTQYDELQAKVNNGETLDARQEGILRDLKTTLNSKESKGLKDLLPVLPKPETDFEKQVAQDLDTFNVELNGHIKGSDSESKATLAFIESKCQGMTREQKLEYIRTALKFYNGSAPDKIFSAYSKEFPELKEDKYLIGLNALTVGEASAEDYNKFSKIVKENIGSKDEYLKQEAGNAVSTAGQILSRTEYNNKPEKDAVKSAHTQLLKDVGSVEDLKQGTTLVTTMASAEAQIKAQENIYNAKNANDDVFVDATDKAKLFASKAQVSVLKGAMDRSSKATANVAENNIISGLAKENQTEAFTYTREMIEKQFKEDDAIKYSNALADQIQNCHKDNQLDMHNDIMNSKYSEVQEHAASNINKLDPTVQNDAIDTVIRSGNEKAISAAMDSMQKCSPEVQKVQTINMAVQNALENAEAEEKAKLLNSTHLTPEQFAKLTPSEKKDYYKRIFDKASPSEKIEMLSKLPGSQQKTVYTLICRFFPEVLSSMLKDSTMAEKMLNSGMPVDAVNKVITILQASEDLQIMKLLGDLEDNPLYKSYFADKKEDEVKKAQEQQSGGIDFIRNTFATSPKDLAINNKKIKGNMDLRV